MPQDHRLLRRTPITGVCVPSRSFQARGVTGPHTIGVVRR